MRSLVAFTLTLAITLAINSVVAPALAKSVVQRWDPIPGATLYEYDVAEGFPFRENRIVKQGQSESPSVELDLDGGLYSLRIRAIGRGGEPGLWSKPLRIVVLESGIDFVRPVANEKIAVPSRQSSILVEWKGVAGVDDYQVQFRRLNPQGEPLKSIIVNGTQLATRELAPGQWRVQVLGRGPKGTVLSQSEPRDFEIAVVAMPEPELLEPRQSEILRAYQPFDIAWVRKIPGRRSSVEIYRGKGGGIIFRRDLDGDADDERRVEAESLPPGVYQIRVQDSAVNSEDKSERMITVLVEEDPLQTHRAHLGSTARFLTGAMFGWVGQRHHLLSPGAWAYNDDQGFFTVDLRLQGRIWSPWGFEASLGADGSRQAVSSGEYSAGTTAGFEEPDPYFAWPSRWHAGATYRFEPWGKPKPLLAKALLSLREHKTAFATFSTSRGIEYVKHNFRTYGLVLGAEWQWAGWSTAYDLLFEGALDFPLAAGGSTVGTGSPRFYSPQIMLNALLRRKVGRDFRLTFGFEFRAEHLAVGEQGGRRGLVQDQAVFGTRLGADWDL